MMMSQKLYHPRREPIFQTTLRQNHLPPMRSLEVVGMDDINHSSEYRTVLIFK